MKPDETIPSRVDFWEPIWHLDARMTNGPSLSDGNHRRLSVLDGLHPLARVSGLLSAEMGLVVEVQVTWSMSGNRLLWLSVKEEGEWQLGWMPVGSSLCWG